MKGKNKERLQQDMIHYCDQIGILPNERPRLIFNRKEANELFGERYGSGHRLTGRNTLGRCWISNRLIYVTELVGRDGRVGKYVPMRQKGWKRWISRPWNYRRQKEVLVHELVHYRFPNMQHGKQFEHRIKEILKGQTFEPKHIHLFANCSKRHKEGIDLDPVAVPQTPKKEYTGTLDYFV